MSTAVLEQQRVPQPSVVRSNLKLPTLPGGCPLRLAALFYEVMGQKGLQIMVKPRSY